MKGDVVRAPDGTEIVLDDVGQRVLLEHPLVRVWDISLTPAQSQHWHLHGNPYVILSVEASPGRMDWLDGSPARYVDEYVGGSVYRASGPVHRLTNIGGAHYRNRLVEFKELGENRPPGVDVGAGVRSVRGERPPVPPPGDDRLAVLTHPHTTVWQVDVPARSTTALRLAAVPHVLVALTAPGSEEDPASGVRFHLGGAADLANPDDGVASWFVVELTHLANLDAAPAVPGPAPEGAP